MGAFELLRAELRRHIYELGWQSLRPIQEVAIERAVHSDHNFIIAAATAAGKTEAAFLPAINNITNFDEGCKIIYISPLVALINDQFERLERLCAEMTIALTSWHGEANFARKRKLIEKPNGILLITPESIEAMLSLRPSQASALFGGTEWLIIDEIHSFMSSNRGVHLRALIERIKPFHRVAPRYIGLSATLHRADYQAAKTFFSSGRKTDVIIDKRRNKLSLTIDYFPEKLLRDNTPAVDRIYQFSQKQSMLVFPNSRSEVERLAVQLAKLAQARQSEVVYFAHHASVSRDIRREAERFAKMARGRLFTICCTSTLELGIDIGAVDSIVQYNAPHSVYSLAQRLGRSGRRSKNNVLHFIASNPWALLQGLAAIDCYRQANLEQLEKIEKPFDVLAHQMIALVVQNTSLKLGTMRRLNRQFNTFKSITDEEINRLLDYLIEQDYLEVMANEVFLGLAAEHLLKGSKFFAHFETKTMYNVFLKTQKIGEIPLSPTIRVASQIYLSAHTWRIISIDTRRHHIYVEKSQSGRAPSFGGSAMQVSGLLRQQMRKIVAAPRENADYHTSFQALLSNTVGRPQDGASFHFREVDNELMLITFASTRVNRSLHLMLTIAAQGEVYSLEDDKSAISGPQIKQAVLALAAKPHDKIDIYNYLKEQPELVNHYMSANKYRELLPMYLRIVYLINNYLDIDGARQYLSAGLALEEHVAK